MVRICFIHENNICKLVTIIEILKKKMRNLQFKIDLCQEKNSKREKLNCMKININISDKFLEENKENIHSNYWIIYNIELKTENEKRETVIKNEENRFSNQEDKCLENMNKFFNI